jgi:hypothetical protein
MATRACAQSVPMLMSARFTFLELSRCARRRARPWRPAGRRSRAAPRRVGALLALVVGAVEARGAEAAAVARVLHRAEVLPERTASAGQARQTRGSPARLRRAAVALRVALRQVRSSRSATSRASECMSVQCELRRRGNTAPCSWQQS